MKLWTPAARLVTMLLIMSCSGAPGDGATTRPPPNSLEAATSTLDQATTPATSATTPSLVRLLAGPKQTGDDLELRITLINDGPTDYHYTPFAYLQRLDGQWINVRMIAFGTGAGVSSVCVTDQPCNITPEDPVVRPSQQMQLEPAVIEDLIPGQYRISMRPALEIDSDVFIVA